MVTIQLTNYQARKLKAVLKADLKDYWQGIEALYELNAREPLTVVGQSGILPMEGICETLSACSVLEAVVKQLNEETD